MRAMTLHFMMITVSCNKLAVLVTAAGRASACRRSHSAVCSCVELLVPRLARSIGGFPCFLAFY